jgi:predicted 3-demethylubiquinone-9 3-methyltransferase (glyoxalase superfamily)
MSRVQRITPFLWFDHHAEEAANFYVAIFPNSRVVRTMRYGETAKEIGAIPGTVMVVDFELEGVHFSALNGGPNFRFTEAVSFVVHCDSQQEVDHYWEKLGEGGEPQAQQCGWLKDRFGLSWQIIPERVLDLLTSGDTATSERAMGAVLKMRKIDIADVERAVSG